MFAPLVGSSRTSRPATCRLPMTARAASLDLFVREVIGTRRKDIIRLIIAEGPRFPALAEFYHREVLSRVIAAHERAAWRALSTRGELRKIRLMRISAIVGGAGPRCHDLEWIVRTLRAARCAAMLKAHLDIILDRRSAA